MHTNVGRIFISSPADVGYERARAERVAERLSGLIDGLTVEIYRWEKDRYFSAHESFQPQILPVDMFDIVVGLFWSRVGSALPPSFPKMPDGRPYPSGTAYEVLRAIEHRRDSDAQLPDVLVYRKAAPIPISVEKEEERSQQSVALNTLDAFMQEWFVNPQEGFKAAFQSFRDADEFEQLFEMHLRAWLRDNRRLGRERVWRVEEKGSPFRGLKPFKIEHRDAFFGRRADVERARERLNDAAASDCAFLLIEGASGTGKSSMARAGLLPRMKDLDPDLRLAIATVSVNPVETLSSALFSATALPELADVDFDTPQTLAQHLAQGGGITPILRALDRAAATIAERDDHRDVPKLRLALLIDQLEGVCTGSVETLARQRFCEILAIVLLYRSLQTARRCCRWRGHIIKAPLSSEEVAAA